MRLWRPRGRAAAGEPADELRTAVARKERERLARDLHDSVKQQLFTLRMSTATAEARWESDPEGARAAVADARASSERAMVEMEALLRQLRPDPLAGTALVDALREQCEALRYRSGAEVEIDLSGLPADDELPPPLATTLFRIAQEALSNVARHARARRVTVTLRRRQSGLRAWIELAVADDGRGFEPSAERRGLGLTSLESRAEDSGGTCRVESRPGEGCRLVARLPAPVPVVPPRSWGAEAETADFLWLAGTITLSIGWLVISQLAAGIGLEPLFEHSPSGVIVFALVLQAGVVLLLVARARRRRLVRRLDPEHVETARSRRFVHLCLAALGIAAVTALVPHLSPLPKGGLAAGVPSAVAVGKWLATDLAILWTGFHAFRAWWAEHRWRVRLSAASLPAEMLRESLGRLPLVAGAALGLVLATLLEPDPLFWVPLPAALLLLAFHLFRLRWLRARVAS